MPLYPQSCREKKFSYKGTLEITCITKKKNGEEKIMKKISLGKIPIMVGSIKCNLYKKTSEELVSLGECIADPFGYFITSGEKAVITHDKSRKFIPLIVKNKKYPKEIIELYYLYNKRIILKMGKKWNTIKMVDPTIERVHDQDPKSIPIFIIYKLLTGLEPEEVIDKYILRFIHKEYHRKIKNILSESVIKSKNISDPVLYVYNKRNKNRDIGRKGTWRESILENLEADIFINIKEENKEKRIELKVLLLSFVVSKYVLFIGGIIKKDQRDSWVNKAFENAPVLIQTLFGCIWSKGIIPSCKKKPLNNSKIDYISFGSLLRRKSEKAFASDFDSSLNTDNWGVKKLNFKRENYKEVIVRTTPLALWSQMTKNNSSTSIQDPNNSVREVQPSQKNKHCVIETTEGAKAGLLRYRAVTCIISKRVEPDDIINVLNIECSPYDKKNYILVLINGRTHLSSGGFVYYCEENLFEILVEHKRYGRIFIETEIVLNKDLNTLSIFTDSSRSMTPYLIVNSKTNELVIDEKNAWKMPYNDLLRNGCIEYLGPWEEESEKNSYFF